MGLDKREFRNTLGRFATGIAVVTATGEDGQPIALTINSFASVSLDPPLVLWSLDRGSECMATFSACTGFGIHFLGAGQQDLSVRFSKKDGHSLNGTEHRIGKGGAPIIGGAHGWLDCRVFARHDGGDHVILVGEVLDLGEDGGETGPLLYYRGRYARLAP